MAALGCTAGMQQHGSPVSSAWQQTREQPLQVRDSAINFNQRGAKAPLHRAAAPLRWIQAALLEGHPLRIGPRSPQHPPAPAQIRALPL